MAGAGVWRDRAVLVLLGLAIMGAGLGFRDPWPPDEPRFAAVARDMVATGEWMLPTTAGWPYPDKPPLFFWAIGAGLLAGLPLAVAALLPSLVASLGTLLLVHDLARRLHARRTAFAIATLLLLSAQFAWQGRVAQIDATLTFFTTLGIYGLARHCLLGPRWGWYATAGIAMGLGVVTKGVGFLPLLALPAVALLRWRGTAGPWGRPAAWALAPLCAALPVVLWAWAMSEAVDARDDPAWNAYRREILIGQTAERYVDAEHHRRFPLYLLAVIPGLWFPAILFLPWVLRGWWRRWWRADPPTVFFTAWAALVVLFFTLSTGKRGVYVLPALPAVALALAPLLAWCARREWFRRAGLATLAVAVVGWSAAGWLVLPRFDGERSGRDFMRRVARAMEEDGGERLGMAGWREQFYLQAPGQVTTFGHRERSGSQRRMREFFAAYRWLLLDPGHRLLAPAEEIRTGPHKEEPWWEIAGAVDLGEAHRDRWLLVDAGDMTPYLRRFLLRDEEEVAQVDQHTGRLARDAYRVAPPQEVDAEGEPAGEAQQPE